ncbi:hypothetical protein ACSKGD_004504 [Vibrio parahaemolyticus]
MIHDKILKSESFVKAQLWVFNGLAGISLAYFLALFSAGEPKDFSFSLELATILFSISLISNAVLALMVISTDKDPEFLHLLSVSKYSSWIPIASMYSAAFAVLALVAHFSWFAFICMVFMGLMTPFMSYKALKAELESIKKRRADIQMETLDTQLNIIKMLREKETEAENEK